MQKRYPRYFEYMTDYADALKTRLGIRRSDPNLPQSVTDWRKSCGCDPENVTMKCRKTIEEALRTLLGNGNGYVPDELSGMINEAGRRNIVPPAMVDRLHGIRKAGNKGAHGYPARHDAETSLIALDEFFRCMIVDLGIDTGIDVTASNGLEPIHIIRSNEELEALRLKAENAALLANNASIKAEADMMIESARQEQEYFAKASQQMSNKFVSAIECFNRAGSGATRRQFEDCIRSFDETATQHESRRSSFSHTLAQTEHRVDEVLKEHDFIMRLLDCNGEATDEQVNVMLFPKTSNSVTNILQISGAAGTGKTLCLLAKLIKQTSDFPVSPSGRPSKALFVCFNRKLAEYVSSLLMNFPEARERIQVHRVDMLINQLVKFAGNVTDESYVYLKNYSNDIRFERGWQIRYEGDKKYNYALTREAMRSVAGLHPEAASKGKSLPYYLNTQDDSDVGWVDEELCWLEARYECPKDADPDYLTVERRGRGRRYLPRKDARMILLEIWRCYRDLLRARKQYTIEQASKRLMKSTRLPQFDAIAIDEVQDLSILQIRSLLRLRTSPEQSRVYISGDENQKIYQRDFTWKELDSRLKGHTETLTKNMRNAFPIKRFADRILGNEGVSAADFPTNVFVGHLDDADVLLLIEDLYHEDPSKTTALIGNKSKWEKNLKHIDVPDSSQSSPLHPGVHLLRDREGKGLEFDYVLVDYSRPSSSDEDEERRIRYMHFTRARSMLYVFYSGKPPKLLSQVYPELIH